MYQAIRWYCALLLFCAACTGSKTTAESTAPPVIVTGPASETPLFVLRTRSIDARTQAIARHLQFESDNPDDLILHPGYVINYDTSKKVPNWTIHELTPAQIDTHNVISRPNTHFKRDTTTQAPDQDKQASHNDYTHSGFDRGHFTPAADFSQDSTLKAETFLMTNIAPQTPDLNQDLWAILEDRIRGLVRERKTTAIVITGALYKAKRAKNRGISSRRIGIPSSFYKVVYLPVDDAADLYAFLVPHLFAYDVTNLACYQVTLATLEEQTGETFLENAPHIASLRNTLIDASPWVSPESPCEQ